MTQHSTHAPTCHRLAGAGRIVRLAAIAAVVLAASAGCQKGRTTEDLIARGNHAYDYGRYEEAERDFKRVLDRYPGDPAANLGYGRTMEAMGRLEEARMALETASVARPLDLEISLALAEVLYEQRDTERLYQLLRDRAVEQGRVEAWLAMADFALRLDDPDTAQMAIVAALELSGARSADPYLEAARLAERVGNQKEAIRRLRQAYGIAPEDPRVIAGLVEYGEVPGPTIALPPGK